MLRETVREAASARRLHERERAFPLMLRPPADAAIVAVGITVRLDMDPGMGDVDGALRIIRRELGHRAVVHPAKTGPGGEVAFAFAQVDLEESDPLTAYDLLSRVLAVADPSGALFIAQDA